MEKERQAYGEILKVLHKHREICVFDVAELERKANVHLFGLELKEKYGLDVDPKQVGSLDYNSFGEWKKIGLFGEKHRRTISWSVDGRQPKDEYLFTVSFPTGAYMFGVGGIFEKDYPTEFFQRFWLELKSYKPNYIDEVNHGLYWKLKNAKEAFNAFDGILKKYYKLNEEDIKRRKIEKLKQELDKLSQTV